jgi:hypothetical protein
VKILYFCNVNRESKAAVGVFKKIDSQIKVLRNEGHEVHLAFYESDSTYSITGANSEKLLSVNLQGIKGNGRTKTVIKKVSEFNKKMKYGCVYSRYETYSLDLARFYKGLHNEGCTVLLEIPTYPISQRWTTIKTSIEQKNIRVALHQFYNATINSLGIFQFRSGVDKIVNNNGFSEIWKIKTLAINNAADVASLRKHTARRYNGYELHLIGVANVAKWHGFDRIIEGIKAYKKHGGSRNIYFHVVGGGLELENLKALSSDPLIRDYIVFHGTVVGKDLDDLFDQADIGVSVLATYRSNMKNNCDSLKSKEYCARGIPFITGELEHFYDEKDFVLTVADNGTPINMTDVCAFADRVLSDVNEAEKIRDFAKAYCGWDYAFRSVINFLKEENDEKKN